MRFTLAADDFEPWLTVIGRYPEWTPMDRKSSKGRAHGQSTLGWYCRPDSLPLVRVIAVDTRAYSSHRWESFNLSSAVVLEDTATILWPNKDRLGIKLGDKIYWSTRELRSNGHHAYEIPEDPRVV